MIRSCGFATSDQARVAADELWQALLLAGAKNVRGVSLEEVEVAQDSDLLIMGTKPGFAISQAPSPFTEQLTAFFGKPPLKKHEKVAAELINDVSFHKSPETRFLLGIISIETLCAPHKKKGEKNSQRCQRIIRQFLNKSTADSFATLYRKRNDFAHEGKGRGVLDNEAAEARQIAADLLLAQVPNL
jgi:hypothetical protein